MSIALRAHHLLCVLTYVGKGYDAMFVANYNAIAAHIAAGERVRIVAGPDDVCAPLCHGDTAPHCLGRRSAQRDQRAARDLEPLMGRSIVAGVRFRLHGARLAHLRRAFAQQHVRAACRGCQWHALCTGVAQSGYAQTRI